MNTPSKAFGLSLLALLGLCALRSASAADPPSVQTTTPGIWQKHKYTFNFMGFTSTYSCDGLADKLRLLLRAAGARSDLKSNPGACASMFGRPDKFANADLTFYTLIPLGWTTPPASATDKTTQKEPPQPVTYGRGIWKHVEFAWHSPQELGIGDCELVEQFNEHLLSMFATRDVHNKTTCIPHQDSGSNVDLGFQVFDAAPGQSEMQPLPAPAGSPGS